MTVLFQHRSGERQAGERPVERSDAKRQGSNAPCGVTGTLVTGGSSAIPLNMWVMHSHSGEGCEAGRAGILRRPLSDSEKGLGGEVPLRDLRGAITVEPPQRSFWKSASCAASSRRSLLILALGLLILLAASLTQAQDGGAAITDDQVNAIASRMFCPVCENEPLDVCMTAACARWREDIRGQLAAGRTEDQIIADFVARYGERASATPLDPTLRGLSVYVPWLIAGVVLLGGGWVFWRWRIARRPLPVVPPAGQPAVDDPDEAAYRATLERDLKD